MSQSPRQARLYQELLKRGEKRAEVLDLIPMVENQRQADNLLNVYDPKKDPFDIWSEATKERWEKVFEKNTTSDFLKNLKGPDKIKRTLALAVRRYHDDEVIKARAFQMTTQDQVLWNKDDLFLSAAFTKKGDTLVVDVDRINISHKNFGFGEEDTGFSLKFSRILASILMAVHKRSDGLRHIEFNAVGIVNEKLIQTLKEKGFAPVKRSWQNGVTLQLKLETHP